MIQYARQAEKIPFFRKSAHKMTKKGKL